MRSRLADVISVSGSSATPFSAWTSLFTKNFMSHPLKWVCTHPNVTSQVIPNIILLRDKILSDCQSLYLDYYIVANAAALDNGFITQFYGVFLQGVDRQRMQADKLRTYVFSPGSIMMTTLEWTVSLNFIAVCLVNPHAELKDS